MAETDRQTDTELFHLLFYSLNAENSKSGVRLKPGAWTKSGFPMWVTRTQMYLSHDLLLSWNISRKLNWKVE